MTAFFLYGNKHHVKAEASRKGAKKGARVEKRVSPGIESWQSLLLNPASRAVALREGGAQTKRSTNALQGTKVAIRHSPFTIHYSHEHAQSLSWVRTKPTDTHHSRLTTHD